MARVGIVSYYAPPQQAIAGQRVLRVSRVLRAAGHEVHWITVDPERLPFRDPALMPLVPEGIVVHGVSGPSKVVLDVESTFDRAELTLIYALKNNLGLPDGHLGWAFNLRRRLPGIAARCRLDAVFVSVGPHSSLLAMPALRKALPRLKIILDYRDLLLGNPWNEPKQVVPRLLLRRRELAALAAADAVFVNTSQALEAFRKALGAECRAPVSVMRNAADYPLAADIARIEPPVSMGPGAHFGFFGALYPKRRLRPFLDGMALLSPAVRDQITLHCYGLTATAEILEQDLAAIPPPVAARVQVHPQVPFRTAVRTMQAMHGLVLVNGPGAEDQVFVPGKLFDYLMARRPIVFVGGQGDAWDIVRDTSGAELCFTYSELPRLAEAIARIAQEAPREIAEAPQLTPQATFAPLLELVDRAAAS